MAEELGKIEKLGIDKFTGIRKLYVIPLFFAGSGAPQDYVKKLENYWREVNEQIANQEAKVGKINRIYHESIPFSGEEGLKIVEKISSLSHLIIKDKCDCGAVFEATEQADLADECMDWERCLLLGFFSPRVAETVAELYRQSAIKRFEYISQQIDKTLRKDEVAILFIREGHMVQFAKDIEVFNVAPPALDELHRWIRDQSQSETEEDKKES
jgi:hypothetical protein